MISCCDCWPRMKPGYVTITWRQSNNQWSGGIAAHPIPKNSECKNLLEKFLPWFFVIKMAPSSVIIFQRATLSTRSITHLCWCNLRKNTEGRSPRGVLFLYNNALAHRALATHEKLAYLGFQCLDHPPCSPDLALLDYHLFPGLQNNWKVTIFLLTWRSVLPRRPGSTDKFLNFFFFWVACKS